MSLHHTHTNQWRQYVAKTLQRSPLFFNYYEHLKEDPEILKFLDLIEENQPGQILFFATVMFLLLCEADHELASFYPYFTAHPRPPEEAYPYFRAFCLEHAQALKEILPTVRLQTNETMRCFCLLFAFDRVFQQAERLPLALIEIGSSLGLNLNWQQYAYHYKDWHLGNLSSAVQLYGNIEGKYLPPFPEDPPCVASIQGIELFPLDLASETDVSWVQACIWPEESERYPRLDAALLVAQHSPPPIHYGEASELLPGLLCQIPFDQTICIWHSFALNQGPGEIKERVEQILADESQYRDVYRISLEVDQVQGGKPRLEIFAYQHGRLAHREWLANCAIHGETMEWLLPVARF